MFAPNFRYNFAIKSYLLFYENNCDFLSIFGDILLHKIILYFRQGQDWCKIGCNYIYYLKKTEFCVKEA